MTNMMNSDLLKFRNLLKESDIVSLGLNSNYYQQLVFGRGTSGASGSFARIGDVAATEMTAASKLKISSSSDDDNGIASYGTITQVTGAVKATGNIAFTVNPTASDTITMYGTAFTFVESGATGNQVNIGTDLAATLAAAVVVLNASVVTNVAKATYTADATKIYITFDNYGTGGNSYTLAASAATRSGATLTGGANGVGSIAFTKNLYVGDILTINGTAFTIVASGATGNQIDVDTTLSATLDKVVTALNASAVTGVALATYSKTGTNTTLTATYDDSALSGSAFTLAATSLGSSGARTVRVYALDENWNQTTVDIALNGQTAVETTLTYLHPYLIRVLTAGSGGTNAGLIYVGSGTVTSGVPDVKYLGVTAGKGISRSSFFPVPAGYKLIIDDVEFNYNVVSSAITMSFEGCVKPFGGVWESRIVATIGSGSIYIPVKGMAYEPKTLIKMQASSSGSAALVNGSYNIQLVKFP